MAIDMDSEDFQELLDTIKNNTAPAVLDLTDKLDETQAITLVESLKTNVSVHNLILRREVLEYGFGPGIATAIANLLRVNQTIHGLDLCSQEIGDEDVQALAAVLKDSRLQSLDLSYNKIGDKGAKALAPAIKESHLQSLGLRYNKIGAKGVQALAAILKDSCLQSLDLADNEIGAEGTKSLADVLKDSHLQHLDLGGNKIGNEGIKALAPVLKDTRFQSLNLRYNAIGAEGAKALAAVLKDSRLQSLDLGSNEIGPEGAIAIATVIKDCRLQSLILCNNQIGAEGAQTVMSAIIGSHLKHLNLARNNIGDIGAAGLATTLKDSPLLSLSLEENRIRGVSAVALIPSIKGSHLQYLDLADEFVEKNKISVDNKAAIRAALKNPEALHKTLSKIKQDLKMLESKFQALLAFSQNQALAQASYAKNCKDIYIQVKHLLQRWENMFQCSSWDKKNLADAKKHWQFLLWECLDKVPLVVQHEIAALPFTWIEEDPSYLDSEQKETQESEKTQVIVVASEPLSSTVQNSVEFKNLLETIKNNTAPAVLDLTKKLDEAQVIQLAESLKTNVSVRSLVLERSFISIDPAIRLGPKIAPALADMLRVNRSLQSLNLKSNVIGDEGMKFLVPALKDSRLQSLNLGYNKIGAEGMKVLAPVLKDSRLQRLDLGGNAIGDEGMQFLAIGLKDSHLRSLNLGVNKIGADGAKALAPAIKDSHLQCLILGSNQIGADGMEALAPSLKENRLQSLNLYNSAIGNEGMKALIPVIKEGCLQSLNLSSNAIGNEGMKALIPVVKVSRLQNLNLESNNIMDVENEVLIDEILEPKKIQSKNLIYQNLYALKSKFKQLLTLSPAEVSLVKPSYASQCKALYTQARRQLQAWELIVPQWENDHGKQRRANEAWQLLLWKCLEKLLLAERDDVATLAFSWVEDEDPANSDSEHKEIQESAAIQETSEPTQTISSQPIGQFQQSLSSQEQQLNQRLQEQEKRLLGQIVGLETQLKVKATESLEKELAKLREEQTKLLERQFDPSLLMNQFDILGSNVRVQGQGLDDLKHHLDKLKLQWQQEFSHATQETAAVRQETQEQTRQTADLKKVLLSQEQALSARIETLKAAQLQELQLQLQQKFNFLGQETTEVRQQAQAQHRQAAADLQKSLLAQETALNTRLETLKTEVASGDSAKEAQLLQLQAEHKLLMEEHKAKQQLLAKRQDIESHENLRLFYRSVQVKLQELFLAYKVLDSGMVQPKQHTTKDKIADGIQIAGDWIPLPYASEVIGLVSKFIQSSSDKEKARCAEIVAYTAMSFSEIDSISEETARQLTERYEEQIHQLKPEGAKALGECTLRYMIAYLAGNQLNSDKPLYEQFLHSVLTLEVHNGWWPRTHKNIPVQAPATGWTDNGVFKHPGIKTSENTFFSGEEANKTKAHKYGYRLGTKAEALEAGLTQTTERVVSKVPAQMSLADKKQVAHVSAKADNLVERFELMQKQLEHEHNLRAQEAKKNSEQQAQIAAQAKEMETFRAFMAASKASQSPKSPESAPPAGNGNPSLSFS